MAYMIKIKTSNDQGCWFKSYYGGDPGRTHDVMIATKFDTKKRCNKMIDRLSKEYPNRDFSLDEFIPTKTNKANN